MADIIIGYYPVFTHTAWCQLGRAA
eukprot:COSAG01_NODE_70786_length_257_cov_1.955696_1_plen_24_part_01